MVVLMVTDGLQHPSLAVCFLGLLLLALSGAPLPIISWTMSRVCFWEAAIIVNIWLKASCKTAPVSAWRSTTGGGGCAVMSSGHCPSRPTTDGRWEWGGGGGAVPLSPHPICYLDPICVLSAGLGHYLVSHHIVSYGLLADPVSPGRWAGPAW